MEIKKQREIILSLLVQTPLRGTSKNQDFCFEFKADGF
jgi:hypothetical protein